jgi:hypothetical protein
MYEPLRTVNSVASLCLVALLAACAPKPPATMERESVQTMTATVDAVNLPARMVVLRGEQNATAAVMVGPQVRNLEQVQPGDKVVVSYYQALAAAVRKPGEGGEGVVTDAMRARPGERPGGAVGQAITTTVAIEAVDTSFNTVTFRRPDGYLRTVAVESPEGREFIRKVRPGEQVEVTYTEAVAVDVKPAG